MSRPFRYELAAVAVLLVAGGVFLSYYVKTLGPRLKGRVVSALSDRFDADVQLGNLQFSIFPLARVDGEDLTINHRQWSGGQPLIKIKHFHAETDYTTILDWRNRVNRVVLDGLEIHIPPRGRATLKTGTEANQTVSSDEPGHDTTRLKFLIETIVADNSMVEIEPKEAGKQPLDFPIEKLIMHSVGPGEAMTFTARLRNAKPPGGIDTAGHFGPWQKDDPRATPISGDYTFKNADLSVFKGITGILSSEGQYGGILQHIKINGVTDTPKFNLSEGGVPVHLKTRFHAVVDGTNGDTILDPVDATFRHSEFLCTGGVVQKNGERGKTVELDARTKHGRMEDILALVVNGPPVVDGDVEFQSKILIPPGKVPVLDKLGLDGQFHLTSATFTSPNAAERIRTLSDRAQGISKEEEAKGQGEQGKVASNLFGRFRLDNGEISFSKLSFEVPGAQVLLVGKYNLKSTKVDMDGKFEMKATLSETQSGVKAVLLKPLDPLFRRGKEGFELPIFVKGDREHPLIGVTMFHRNIDIH